MSEKSRFKIHYLSVNLTVFSRCNCLRASWPLRTRCGSCHHLEVTPRCPRCDAGSPGQPLLLPPGTSTTLVPAGSQQRDRVAETTTEHRPGMQRAAIRCMAQPQHIALACPHAMSPPCNPSLHFLLLFPAAAAANFSAVSCYCWNRHLKPRLCWAFESCIRKSVSMRLQQKPFLRYMGNRVGAIFTPLSKRK